MATVRTPKNSKTKSAKNSTKNSDSDNVLNEENEESIIDDGASALEKPGDTISEQLKQKKDRDSRRKMEEELKVLVVKKETVRRKLVRVQSALQAADGAAPNKHFLQLQLKMLESAYTEYNDFQNQVYDLSVGEDVRCAEELKFIDVETLYSRLFVFITERIDATVKAEMQPIAAQPVNNQLHVPPLKAPLPTFDGNYENWFAFKNMFENVMARYQTESPAIKLYQLRNALVGAAAGVIDQDIINNNDYEAAWATLRERFEDKQVIVDKHIDAILNIPSMTKESAVGLRKIIDTCSKNVDALKNLQLPVAGLGEMMLLNVLAKKMDTETRKAWELTQKTNELPDYKSTMEFLKERCRVYEKISRSTKPMADLVKPTRSAGKFDSKVHSLVATSEKCSHCRSDHELWKCDVFKKASLSDKYASLRKSGSCFNCLEKGHVTVKCRSEHSCKQCGKRHHTYLHHDDQQSSESPKLQFPSNVEVPDSTAKGGPSTAPVSNVSSVLYSNVENEQDTLLATATVYAYGVPKKMVCCRAVLDSASHKHFITEELVTKLGLKRKRTNYTIIGIGGNQMAIQYKVQARIKSRVSAYESPCLELLIVKKITGDLPISRFDAAELRIPENVELADPSFNEPGQVDILIGSGLFFKLIMHGQLTSADHLPAVQETQLGWIISGVIPTSHLNVGGALITMVTEDDIGKLLERFWHFDSYDETANRKHSTEDDCVAHFLETHRRSQDGRFVVRLPFNDLKTQLGNSRIMAEKRFLAVERRLDRHLDLKKQYTEFMIEYETLGHMVEVFPSPDEVDTEAFYLPHHCVIKPSSTTTKLRVVFDGSADSASGVSINKAQMLGPTVQNDLISILLKFRSFRFAISADIPKMYRQVAVHENDTNFQRILWRGSRDQPIKVYALRTVTYGLASSPFLATMALRQLADEEESRFPMAAAAVKKSFYIDDMLAGADTLEEASELLQQVVGLLKAGCFDIHKICSNSKEILMMVPEQQREKLGPIGDPEINSLMKTLGIAWNPERDNFTFCIPEPAAIEPVQLTKRVVLSEISRIFDPLGFLGPVLTAAKLIMRELWLLDLHWDQSLPQGLVSLWTDFRLRLQELNGVEIPRWIFTTGQVSVELYGFADASDLAYGACLYARSTLHNGKAEMKLICSKSRVLPKKQENQKKVTTPRAELQAALLLSRLTVKMLGAMEIQFSSVVLHSDSQITLCWISKSPEILQVFVGNRVKEIRELTTEFEWRFIPSKLNPADLISRGVQPHLLRNHDIWWNGPPVLKQKNNPILAPPSIPNESLPEMRTTALLSLTVSTRMKIFDRISRFSIIQRSMAYVVRFTDFIRSGRKQFTKGLPTADEMRRALLIIVRLVQQECFNTEIRWLKEEKDFKHSLKCLNLFLDEKDDTIRVGGRIKRAKVPYDSKHQFLLPYGHPVTIAIIRYLHRTNLHIGQQGLLAFVRQQYWPLRAKSMIRNVVHKCVPCYRMRPKRATQLMGDLPEYRVRGTYPFATVGIDFAGPFDMKTSTSARKAITTKGYVCVFVCMATRAIHLEAVSSLASDAFIAALQRFVSRRGIPEKIVSDNATNFNGANNELKRLADMFKSELHQRNLNEFCVQRNIEWSFIPPRSPHFGGIWEAGVKSAKFHLRPILANHHLSYEEFTTVLQQIEATLNSRPLIPSSDDPNDTTAITPAHFLIGREFQSIPEPSYGHIKAGRLSNLQNLQDLKQKFWHTWSTSYLQELQRRQRDYKVTEFKVGALVLIVDDNLPPLQWRLGRIVELHPGSDGHVRVVSLKTEDSTKPVKRAIKKICVLPLDEEDEQTEEL